MSNVTLTVVPVPADSTVTLTATGYTQVNNTITVPEGTEVTYSVAHANYATSSGTYTPNVTTSIAISLTQPATIDASVVVENLAELLTNSVNLTTKFYDIFINTTPMDVSIQMYNDQNELVTVTIPNRAKDRNIALSGEGSPEGVVTGNVGAAYVDTVQRQVYFKTRDNGENTGWSLVLTESGIQSYLANYLTDNGYLNSSNAIAFLTTNNYINRTELTNTLNQFVPTCYMNQLAGSGTIQLQDNSAYRITPTGAVTFVLPSIVDLTKLHKILVQVNLSTIYSITTGTSYFFDKIAPDWSATGMYNLLYEYDNTNGRWVVGCMVKGAP